MKHLRTLLAAILLAAFVMPSPVPTPADESRAHAIALGLLCVADRSDSDAPHQATGHCVLCLVHAAGAAPETADIRRAATLTAYAAPHFAPQVPESAAPASHQPRAPPFLPV